jgi:hypothetical protein
MRKCENISLYMRRPLVIQQLDLGLDPDISQKYKMGDISEGVVNTL